ncbi:MAG: dephospho-CoA kinase [Pseudonocardiales bacterium]|jgi:dephospho-CoA kinase|nr:dephospho-CoA kinase [Pseudonocardiales bacterium]
MLRVGLTGGMGSGKSMVAARLAQCGASIIDSDRIAREVVRPGSDGLRAVIGEFGEGILAADGALDRSALAARVFSDAGARARLNAIVHPLVAARSAELIAAAPADAIVVQDVPLLVEVGMAAGFPLVIVVYADAAVRLRRLVEQRGMTESDAAARLAAQATDRQHRAAADVWLDNSGSRDNILSAVDRLWAQRLVPFEKNLRHRRPVARACTPAVVAPDTGWPEQAQRVIARIAAVAGRRAHRVDHIGSTAVPGLAAKDVLDIQVVVADLAAAEQFADDLLGAGLIRRDGRWYDIARDGTTRDKAMATNADPGRAVNCHIRPADSLAWRDAVLLRDWLRAHPDGVREYAELKHRLAAQQWDSIDAYATAKTPFVASALDRAQRWAARTGWLVG